MNSSGSQEVLKKWTFFGKWSPISSFENGEIFCHCPFKIWFHSVDGRRIGKGLNGSSRWVRFCNQGGLIRGRGCTEQASRKQGATKIFMGSGRHKHFKLNSQQGGMNGLVVSVSYSRFMFLLMLTWLILVRANPPVSKLILFSKKLPNFCASFHIRLH